MYSFFYFFLYIFVFLYNIYNINLIQKKNNSMKSVITCDLEGKILTMNDGAEKLFGYSKEELN